MKGFCWDKRDASVIINVDSQHPENLQAKDFPLWTTTLRWHNFQLYHFQAMTMLFITLPTAGSMKMMKIFYGWLR